MRINRIHNTTPRRAAARRGVMFYAADAMQSLTYIADALSARAGWEAHLRFAAVQEGKRF